MKLFLFGFFSSTVILVAANPQLPTFSGNIGAPLELSLIGRSRLDLSLPEKGALATSPLRTRHIEVTPRAYQSRMPVVTPESGVDHKMAIVRPDTTKSYKLLMRQPDVE